MVSSPSLATVRLTWVYLSLEGLYEAIGQTRATHCDACFTGDYPLERTESSGGKFALEELAVVQA
jgi:amidophosphoribosyltransferase